MVPDGHVQSFEIEAFLCERLYSVLAALCERFAADTVLGERLDERDLEVKPGLEWCVCHQFPGACFDGDLSLVHECE